MPTYTDTGARNAGCILTEANGHRSRANITTAAGAGILAPNTVLGQITATGANKGKYRAVSPDAVDGSQVAAAVLLYRADATAADVWVAGLVRDAEVNGKTLVYAPTVNTQALRLAADAQLAAAGVIVR